MDESILRAGLRATRVDKTRLLCNTARRFWVQHIAQGGGVAREE